MEAALTLHIPIRFVPPRLGVATHVRDAAAVLLVLAWCGGLFFVGLDRGELYRTEGLRALLASEVLAGDWVVPMQYGEPLLTKPPGMYWAIALASWPAGRVTEVSARLPSALAAMATVLLLAWQARRVLGRGAGLVTGLMAPVSLFWLEKAPAAEIDALQVFWVTAAVVCLLRAVESSEARPSGPAWLGPSTTSVFWMLALLCVAGGFLTKWTAPAFFYLTAVPFLALRGRLRDLVQPPHLIAVTVAAMLCLAWIGAVVHRVGWTPWQDAVLAEAWGHLAEHTPRHPRNPWLDRLTHPLVLLAANLPWAVLALFTLRRGFAASLDQPRRRWWQLLHCWIWPSVLFWSLAAEHSPRHAAPLFPAFAGLAAMTYLTMPRVPALVAALVVWLGVKIAFETIVMPQRMSDREPRANAARIAELVPTTETLYLRHLKDDGMMFYLGRAVRRWPPVEGRAGYLAVTEAEWHDRQQFGRLVELGRVRDQQGGVVIVTRVEP